LHYLNVSGFGARFLISPKHIKEEIVFMKNRSFYVLCPAIVLLSALFAGCASGSGSQQTPATAASPKVQPSLPAATSSLSATAVSPLAKTNPGTPSSVNAQTQSMTPAPDTSTTSNTQTTTATQTPTEPECDTLYTSKKLNDFSRADLFSTEVSCNSVKYKYLDTNDIFKAMPQYSYFSCYSQTGANWIDMSATADVSVAQDYTGMGTVKVSCVDLWNKNMGSYPRTKYKAHNYNYYTGDITMTGVYRCCKTKK
jgi:hypothetical protein